MAISTGAQGTYANVTGVTDATAKGEIKALLDVMVALYGPADGSSAASPDFNLIPKHVKEKLDTEIAAIKTAIDAAPVV